jgi:hypothetical protein
MGDRSYTSSIPTDQYGPLNVYNGYRIDSRNPGGALSQYSADGNLRLVNEDDPNQYMSAAWIAAQQALNQAMPLDVEQIAAIEAHVAAEQPIRQSLRVQGIPADDNDCTDQICLITQKRIKLGDGIRLSDGRCYDVRSIIGWFDHISNTRDPPYLLPTRVPFSDEDVAKMNSLRGGKKRRKGRKTRKGRKSRKRGKKTRKGRKCDVSRRRSRYRMG